MGKHKSVRATTCRRCTGCEGQDHHWMPDCDEETGLPLMVCKHCETTRPYTDDDDDDFGEGMP